MDEDWDCPNIDDYVPYQSRAHFMSLVRKNDTVKAIDYMNTLKVRQLEIYTAARYAIKCGHLEMLTTLIDYLGDPDLDYGYPIPLLHLPVYYGNLEMLVFLIDSGMNVNTRDKEGYTALMIAAKYGQFEFVKTLLASNANPEIERAGRMNALSLAATNEHYPIANFLAGGEMQ